MNVRITLVLLTLLGSSTPGAFGQTYERLDVSSTGVFGNTFPQRAVVSDDGTIAAFSTAASNLVLPDDPTSVDLFLRDRSNSTTVRIASNIGTTPGGVTPPYYNLAMTGDGRWIVYSDWGPGRYETYVYDRLHGTTTQVAASLLESLPTGITPDGRYVSVVGRNALNNTPYDAWRYDTQTGALLLASPNMQGGQGGVIPQGTLRSISADGNSIVFSSQSANLVPNDTNGTSDVFVFDVSTSTVERMSINDAGLGGDRESMQASISGDGSGVAFWTPSSNFAPLGGRPIASVYLRDRTAGTTRLVGRTTAGVPLSADAPRISSDGRKVAFVSLDTTVIPGDNGAGYDIFLNDIASGVTSAVTPGASSINVEYNLDSLAAGGRFVTFGTSNPSMPNHSSLGGLYLADVGPACSTASYCTALPNSTGVAASIGSQGDASLHADTFALTASNLPPNAIAIFASGTSAMDPGISFGNGLRCIGGTLVRHGVLHASAGSVIEPQDFSAPRYAGTRPGDVLNFQCVYRDPSAGGAAFNTTDALAVTFCY